MRDLIQFAKTGAPGRKSLRAVSAPETLTFLECAARLQGMIDNASRNGADLQDIANIVSEMASQHIGLMRFLNLEFPDAEKIRKSIFGNGCGND